MSNTDVVVKQQDEIKVFGTVDGQILLIQKTVGGDDDVISVNAENAEAVANALMSIANDILRGE